MADPAPRHRRSQAALVGGMRMLGTSVGGAKHGVFTSMAAWDKVMNLDRFDLK